MESMAVVAQGGGAAGGDASPAVEVRNLRVSYGSVRAVDGIELTVRRGETFGLLGSNGAGKTTTLSVLQGLKQPEAGSHVAILGLKIDSQAAAVRQRIGVSLQSTSLFERLTLVELLRFYAACYDRRMAAAEARKLLDRFGLGEKANVYAKQLSGGQQQRAALAVALVNDPELVFLDEPTTGLDPQARRFTNRMGQTFRWVGWLWLAFCAGAAFTVGQVQLGTVCGATVTALVIAFAMWYGLSYRLLGPIRFGMPIWRATCYLAGLLVLSLALTYESIYFVATIWMLFGLVFGTFHLPIAVPLGVVMGLLAARMSGMLPADMLSGESLYQLGLTLLILLMWIIMAILLQHLISVRFANARLIEQLEAAQGVLHRQAQAEQENAVLRERTRVARDVHDGVGHALTLIAVKAEAAQRLMAIDGERVRAELDQIKTVARDGMQDLRQSVAQLREPPLNRLPLMQSIRDYAAEMASSGGWRLTLDLPPESFLSLRPEVEEAMWRTVQEALTNILRHASAGHVGITLAAATAGLLLTIQDDGRGMQEVPVASGHFGLRGLNERAEILGGTLSVSSLPGHGTTLVLSLPNSGRAASEETNDAYTLTPV